jgi:hypothetical protein
MLPVNNSCQLQVIMLGESIQGFAISEQKLIEFPFAKPTWIEPLHQNVQVLTSSPDGYETLLVRFETADGKLTKPYEFEYNHWREPRNSTYCVKLEKKHEGVPVR